MSRSPTEITGGDRGGYLASWAALNRLMRQGSSFSGREQNTSYLNTGDGRFCDVSSLTGLGFKDDARSIATVDLDHDGDLDVWLANRTGPRLRFLRNEQAAGHRFVALRLRGVRSNTDGVGARVEVHLRDGRKLVRSLHAGEGFLAQSTLWLHFGLGRAGEIERVRVRWPRPAEGGEHEEFEVPAEGGHFLLREGTAKAERWVPPQRSLALAAAELESPARTSVARIVLAEPVPMPTLSCTLADGTARRLLPAGAGPRLVALWASWCAPCVKELRGLALERERWAKQGLELVALSADDEATKEQATKLLAEIAFPGGSAFATPSTVDALDVLQRSLLELKRRIALPTSFLVDAQGRVVVIYRGPVEAETLQRDLALCDATPEERLAAASAFAGRWHAAPPKPDLGSIAAQFDEQGLAELAADYRQHQFQLRQTSRAGMLNEFGLVRARQGQLEQAIAHFRDAVELEPDFFDARSNLAIALHETGQVEEAIRHYEGALRIQSTATEVLYNLYLACKSLGREERAQEVLAAFEVLDPVRAAALRGLRGR